MAALNLASNLSTLPTAGAEASPGKCHQVLPLLRALRVPTAQRRHPITFLLPVALQPCRTRFCSPIGGFSVIPTPRHHPPVFTSGSWACSFPPPVLPPPSRGIGGNCHNPEPGACLPLQRPPYFHSLEDHYSILQGPAYTSLFLKVSAAHP